MDFTPLGDRIAIYCGSGSHYIGAADFWKAPSDYNKAATIECVTGQYPGARFTTAANNGSFPYTVLMPTTMSWDSLASQNQILHLKRANS